MCRRSNLHTANLGIASQKTLAMTGWLSRYDCRLMIADFRLWIYRDITFHASRITYCVLRVAYCLSVQSLVDFSILPVQLGERGEELVVQRAICRIGMVLVLNFDIARYLVHAEIAQAERGDERGAARVRQHRVFDLANRAIQHVSVNLTPEVGIGAAPPPY